MFTNLFSQFSDVFAEPGTADRRKAEREAREAAAQLTAIDGGKLRDDAIDRVEAAAPPDFMVNGLSAVGRCATMSPAGFTTDDVWATMPDDVRPPEPRAMGAVMRAAERSGIIVPTASYRPSNRPECHRNPKRVWVAAEARKAA